MDLLDPREDDITLDDIAYSLARINRFTGHTNTTVAQHSVSVMLALYHQPEFPAALVNWPGTRDARNSKALLIALMHDAHEAYTGDISLPMKEAIRRCAQHAGLPIGDSRVTGESPVTPIKRGIQRVIHRAFDLPQVVPAILRTAIEVADQKMLEIEVTMERDWNITPWGTQEAEDRFSRIAHALMIPSGADFIGQYEGEYRGEYGKEVG